MHERDYREVLDPLHRRKALLYRAALACGVMLLLVVGLSLYDDTPEQAQPALAGPSARLGLVPPPVEALSLPLASVEPAASTAPPSTNDEPLVAEEGSEVEARLDEEEVPLGDGVAAVLAASEPVPAPVSVDAEPEPSPEPDAAVEPEPTPSPRQAPPRTPPPAARTPVVQAGYVVRLGGYAEIAGIEGLVTELAAAGHPASTQWRVSAGPFPSRAAAIEAMRALERGHRQRGLIVPWQEDRYLVQLGVFSEVANADGLQRRVRAWGYPVVRDARIMLGPYSERDTADAAAGELRQARGLEAVVVVPGGR